MIYCGPLGHHSSEVIKYFEVRLPLQFLYVSCYLNVMDVSFLAENSLLTLWFQFSQKAIPGVEKIRDNYNPAAWMLEVTSSSSEAELGLDFAEIYKKSSLHE